MKNILITDPVKLTALSRKESKRIATIFSDKTGIINAVLRRRELERFGFYMFQSLSAQTKILWNLDKEISSGGLGVDKDITNAARACIGEAIERYCLSYIPSEELKFCRLKEIPLQERAGHFDLYSRAQYRKHKSFLDPLREKIHWIRIKNLRNPYKNTYWPASLVFMPFELSKNVAEVTSTGVAAHPNLNQAILTGALELVERDALMINFLKRLNPPEIDQPTIKGDVGKLIENIKKTYRLKIYKLYSDIDVPIYLSLIWRGNRGKDFHFGIGASAQLDSDRSLAKSLIECLFTYFYSKNLMDLRISNPRKIQTLYEHFLFYQDKELFPKLIFNSELISYKSESRTKARLINSLNSAGLDIFYKEITTSDVKVTRIRSVRVIIPGLIDMNKSHILPRMGARRFKEVPHKLHLKSLKGFWEMPHPFP